MSNVYPIKITAHANAINPENLLIRKILQIDLNEPVITEFSKDGYVILDFGKEMNGGVRILTFWGNADARIRFGESLTECCSDVGEKNATNDHAVRDFVTYLPSFSDMTFTNTGYRYIRVDFFGEFKIKSIIGTNHILRKKPLYVYNGSDSQVKKIFSAAKRTLDLCAGENYIREGVKRDRLVWIGDMYPIMIGLAAIYGKLKVIENSLDFVRNNTPVPQWMNDYPMYSMWWINIVADYAQLTDSYPFAEKQLDYMERLVGLMNTCVKENGELDYPSYFIDWPTSGKPDELTGVRALNVITVKNVIKLFEKFGRNADAAKNLLGRLLKIKIEPKESKQVIGLKYFAVGLTESEKKILVKDGCKGMSTFMSYFILTAVASFDKEKAAEMMKDYYGAMLKAGATTFWEDFDIDWTENSCKITEFPKRNEKDVHGDFGAYCYKGFRHSLCHGWSAGVAAFIKENL